MTLKLKRIAPLQAGKMLAALYGGLSLIFIPFFLVFMAIAGAAAKSAGGTSPFAVILGMGVGFIVVLPLMYAAMGFLAGIIGAFIYNLLAGWIGGFELEFSQPVPPVVV